MAPRTDPHRVVSFDSEQLILVDSEDREVGQASKVAAHEGQGLLHRAFSLFLFNEAGEVLLQQRAAGKPLWPGYWANSCCSHPRVGEDMHTATVRRLREELGMECALEFIYKFQYHAEYGDVGSESELCWVFAGRTAAQPVHVNATEIAAWRYVVPADLDRDIAAHPEIYSPWLKLEWPRLRTAAQERGWF